MIKYVRWDLYRREIQYYMIDMHTNKYIIRCVHIESWWLSNIRLHNQFHQYPKPTCIHFASVTSVRGSPLPAKGTAAVLREVSGLNRDSLGRCAGWDGWTAHPNDKLRTDQVLGCSMILFAIVLLVTCFFFSFRSELISGTSDKALHGKHDESSMLSNSKPSKSGTARYT